MANFSFDATTVAPAESIGPIPAGVYVAQVIESDVQPLKSGNGRALKLTLQILQGQYANRKVWAQLNIQHSNAEAERIAQQQLSALCHAVGKPRLNDTTELHMKPVQIRVKIRKDATGQYEDRNEVTGFEAVVGGAVPRPGIPAGVPAATPQAPAAPAGAAAAPWARRSAGAAV
jgi:hypothetical protein